MLKKFQLFFLAFLVLLLPCLHAKPNDNSPQDTWVTIFVHGIIGIKPHLSFGNFFRLMQDQISSTVYARTIELTRKDPFFFQGHPMQEVGLHEVDIDSFNSERVATIFAHYYDSFQRELFPDQQDNHYYTYGWSGLLSRKMRYHEAELFYQALLTLLHSYQEKNIQPKLRIIGYSHGGDFSLKLATINHLHKEPVYIDELILLGTPVLPEAHELIQDATFKKIYHIYSYGDRVQKVDFFSSQHLFSHRTFKDSSCFKIPPNMVQINLQVKRPIFSKELLCHEEDLCRRHVRSIDPGHTELWSFGWIPQGYRSHFPLNPFPAGIFIPYIIHATETECLPRTNNYIVDIRPYNQTILVKNKRPRRKRKTVCLPFINHHEFEHMAHTVLKYKPRKFTHVEYDQHINQHLIEAEKERIATAPRCVKKRRTTKAWNRAITTGDERLSIK